MMSQNREPPAYQEFAATMLSRLEFRTMSLQERGLLYTMRLEFWVNKKLPKSSDDLAKVLGLPVAEVKNSLPSVMHFFDAADSYIFSKELDDYRMYLAERRNRQSAGGKRGSAVTNGKRKKCAKRIDAGVEGNSASNSRVPRQGLVESSVQTSTAQHSQKKSVEKAKVIDPFVDEYEAVEGCAANDYAAASRGD